MKILDILDSLLSTLGENGNNKHEQSAVYDENVKPERTISPDIDTPYTKHELILLKYVDNFKVGERFPNYFSNVYHLNVMKTIKKFLDDELLTLDDVKVTLQKMTVKELKDFMNGHGLKSSGKKSELIEVIMENIPNNMLINTFGGRQYNLTEKGKELLSSELDDYDYQHRFEPEYENFDEVLKAVKAKQYAQAESKIKKLVSVKSGFSVYANFLNFDVKYNAPIDSAKVKPYMIAYYMYGARSETAQRHLLRNYGIDLPKSYIHKALRVIQAIDHLTEEKQLSKALRQSGGKVKYAYSIETMEDIRVCEKCRKHQCIKYDIDKAIIGVNYPPFDDCESEFCRCYASADIIDSN